MRNACKIALAVAAAVMALCTPVAASPYFLIDSEIEWAEARSMGRVQPMEPAEWSDYMAHWAIHLEEGEPYPPNTFIQSQLYVWGGGGGGGLEPEDAGLVMVWGSGSEPPGSYSSAWRFIYALDPDLTGSTINITVTAPQFSPLGNQVNNVSFGIQDTAGNIRSWHWNCGPGQPILWNTPTQITINPMMLSVNAANPPASAFANNPMFNLMQSISFIVDENAVWVANQGVPPPGGGTIARMWNYWHNLYVTPPIPPKLSDPLKWSQPVVEVQPGLQPPLFNGWDEKSLQTQPPVCADDWECTDARPVTDIHWWGSFLNWTQPEPPVLPSGFHLAIWTDVPAGPTTFSHPGVCVWEHFCDTYTWNFAGYDKDPRGQYENEACFQFHQYIPRDKWFYQDPGPNGRNVYWLSIAAVFDEVVFPWGWKTRPHFFNDDAVRIQQVFDPTGLPAWPPKVGYSWAQGTPIEYPTGISWDLAFELTTIELEEWDWGDAPEPPYQTKAPPGPSHKIVQGFCLGGLVDAEADGQPDANALGDDNNGDDEDGVIFGSVIPGQNATANVTVTTPPAAAFLDAWIDFNNNGTWTDAGEQIAAAMPVANGPNPVTFAVPATVVPGSSVFARFRLSTTGGLAPGGAANDGEVEDYSVPVGFKWTQKPDLATTGIDVNATQPFILADDFLCTVTGPITDIHLWGSWWHDILPESDPHNAKFRLSIHKDVPAGPQTYSHPGEVLWVREFNPGEFAAHPYAQQINEGWMDPPQGYEFPGDHTCWQYDFQIPDVEAFHQRGTPQEPVVYWLDVQAEPMSPDARFGWKTSLDHWNDDAVWGQGIEPYPGPWQELRYPPNHEFYPNSIDLAFAITGRAGQVPVGTLTVKQNHLIKDHFWWPTSDPDNEMASLAGTADAVEGINWTSLTLQASGSGNDAFGVSAVKVWLDNNNDAVVDPADILIGTGVYPVDNGSVTIALAPAPAIPAGGSVPVIVSYTMNTAGVTPGQTFRFDVTAATGIGQTSGMPVTVVLNPNPIPSARKIIGLKPISIGQAKKLPLGSTALLVDKEITADFMPPTWPIPWNWWYMEEPDRSSGIGVQVGLSGPLTIGNRVEILARTVLLNTAELQLQPIEVLVSPHAKTITPLGMNNRTSGGGLFGAQPALMDQVTGMLPPVPSMMTNNVGSLIKTWGRVTGYGGVWLGGANYVDVFWMDDGSWLHDGYTTNAGLPSIGVAVVTPRGIAAPPTGFWSVTGIMRAIQSPLPGGYPVRLLVPRDYANDMFYYGP